MSVASGTATTVELSTLYDACYNLEVMLRPYKQGDATGGVNGKDGRFTKIQLDNAITTVSAAITAVNA